MKPILSLCRGLRTLATFAACIFFSGGAKADNDPIEIKLVRSAGVIVTLRVPQDLILNPSQTPRPTSFLYLAFNWSSLRALTTDEKKNRKNPDHAFVYIVSDLRALAIGFSGVTVWDVYDSRSILSSGLILERRADLHLLDLKEIERRKLHWFSPVLVVVDPQCVFARDFFVPAVSHAETAFDKVIMACGCSRRGMSGQSDAELDRACYIRGQYRGQLQMHVGFDRSQLPRWHEYLQRLNAVLRPFLVDN